MSESSRSSTPLEAKPGAGLSRLVPASGNNPEGLGGFGAKTFLGRIDDILLGGFGRTKSYLLAADFRDAPIRSGGRRRPDGRVSQSELRIVPALGSDARPNASGEPRRGGSGVGSRLGRPLAVADCRSGSRDSRRGGADRRGAATLSRERNGSRSGERLRESSEHHEVGVEADALRAASGERGEGKTWARRAASPLPIRGKK
jgi:hypothetical protein